jgi:hypothetical protein
VVCRDAAVVKEEGEIGEAIEDTAKEICGLSQERIQRKRRCWIALGERATPPRALADSAPKGQIADLRMPRGPQSTDDGRVKPSTSQNGHCSVDVDRVERFGQIQSREEAVATRIPGLAELDARENPQQRRIGTSAGHRSKAACRQDSNDALARLTDAARAPEAIGG